MVSNNLYSMAKMQVMYLVTVNTVVKGVLGSPGVPWVGRTHRLVLGRNAMQLVAERPKG